MFWYYTTITPHIIHHSHFRTHLCFFKYSIFFEHQRQTRKLFISANAHTALSALVLVVDREPSNGTDLSAQKGYQA